MTSRTAAASERGVLAGQRVALVGKLAGMSKREAQQLVREHGGATTDRADADTTLVVVGEKDAAYATTAARAALDDAASQALQRGTLSIISESQLWQQLGLVDCQHEAQQLYTPAMLAGLVGASVSTIRRWQRHGWLIPKREVRRLAYFDFQEVATARRLQELLAAGMTPPAIGKTLATLARQLPEFKRPLAELSIVVQGKQLLVRQDGGLIEPGGQLRFDFEAASEVSTADTPSRPSNAAEILSFAPIANSPASSEQLVEAAIQLEEQGESLAATEMYRAALAAGGPSAETCFLLAELLYQLHDLSAARERYYMAVELDEDYVEARANLGCVLAELGELELAVSAFQGALAFHDDYEDVHYHLGRTLDALDRRDEADIHWEAFLNLAPSSPWADEARERLGR